MTDKRRGCRCERVDPSIAWVRDAPVKDIANAAKDLVADGDTKAADLTLIHAVHTGHAPHELFSSGGKRRKTTPQPSAAEVEDAFATGQDIEIHEENQTEPDNSEAT